MNIDLKKQQEAVKASHDEEMEKLHQEMMKRCVPVAKQVLTIIAEGNLEIGDKIIQRDAEGNVIPMQQGDRPQAHKDVALKIQQAMFDANLLWAERQLIFMLIKQPIEMIQNIVLDDMDTSYTKGLCNLFGLEVMGERSLQDMDVFLKKAKSLGKLLKSKTVEELEALTDDNSSSTK